MQNPIDEVECAIICCLIDFRLNALRDKIRNRSAWIRTSIPKNNRGDVISDLTFLWLPIAVVIDDLLATCII